MICYTYTRCVHYTLYSIYCKHNTTNLFQKVFIPCSDYLRHPWITTTTSAWAKTKDYWNYSTSPLQTFYSKKQNTCLCKCKHGRVFKLTGTYKIDIKTLFMKFKKISNQTFKKYILAELFKSIYFKMWRVM